MQNEKADNQGDKRGVEEEQGLLFLKNLQERDPRQSKPNFILKEGESVNLQDYSEGTVFRLLVSKDGGSKQAIWLVSAKDENKNPAVFQLKARLKLQDPENSNWPEAGQILGRDLQITPRSELVKITDLDSTLKIFNTKDAVSALGLMPVVKDFAQTGSKEDWRTEIIHVFGKRTNLEATPPQVISQEHPISSQLAEDRVPEIILPQEPATVPNLGDTQPTEIKKPKVEVIKHESKIDEKERQRFKFAEANEISEVPKPQPQQEVISVKKPEIQKPKLEMNFGGYKEVTSYLANNLKEGREAKVALNEKELEGMMREVFNQFGRSINFKGLSIKTTLNGLDVALGNRVAKVSAEIGTTGQKIKLTAGVTLVNSSVPGRIETRDLVVDPKSVGFLMINVDLVKIFNDYLGKDKISDNFQDVLRKELNYQGAQVRKINFAFTEDRKFTISVS